MPDLVPVPLSGAPDGLVVLAATRPDGTLPRDRKGRTVPKRVVLAGAGSKSVPPGEDPGLLPEGDWRWMTASPTRRWDTVTALLGDRAWPAAVDLVRAGVLTVDCAVDGLRIGAPTAIRLTDPWVVLCRDRRDDRKTSAAGLRDAARTLAGQVRELDAGLADALDGARGHEPATAPVLVAAAQDLLAGAVHDGPRAFSQNHFGSTKKRDNAPDILTAAGASDDTLAALGLARSPYIGLGGLLTLPDTPGRQVELRSWPGPVRFRVSPALRPALLPSTRALLLIENLQAAETACDAHGDRTAVVWFAGQPSHQALDLIAALAAAAPAVLVAPDADWGGVRIAARLLAVLPDRATVLDCGTAPHQRRDPFGTGSAAGLTALAEHDDPRVAAFAASVLARGYPVEQEASARSVLAAALNRHN